MDLVVMVFESVVAKDHALVAAEKLSVVICAARYALLFENAMIAHQVALFLPV